MPEARPNRTVAAQMSRAGARAPKKPGSSVRDAGSGSGRRTDTTSRSRVVTDGATRATTRAAREARGAREPTTKTPAAERSEVARIGRWIPVTAFVLSLGGFGDAMYLTLEHFTGNNSLVCSSVLSGNCLKVTTSSESMVFGIFPVALLGLIFFTGMVIVNFPTMWRVSNVWVHRIRLGMAIGGMGMVLYLLYAELIEIKAICWWCTGVHVVTFLLFVLVVSTSPALLSTSE